MRPHEDHLPYKNGASTCRLTPTTRSSVLISSFIRLGHADALSVSSSDRSSSFAFARSSVSSARKRSRTSGPRAVWNRVVRRPSSRQASSKTQRSSSERLSNARLTRGNSTDRRMYRSSRRTSVLVAMRPSPPLADATLRISESMSMLQSSLHLRAGRSDREIWYHTCVAVSTVKPMDSSRCLNHFGDVRRKPLGRAKRLPFVNRPT